MSIDDPWTFFCAYVLFNKRIYSLFVGRHHKNKPLMYVILLRDSNGSTNRYPYVNITQYSNDERKKKHDTKNLLIASKCKTIQIQIGCIFPVRCDFWLISTDNWCGTHTHGWNFWDTILGKHKSARILTVSLDCSQIFITILNWL